MKNKLALLFLVIILVMSCGCVVLKKIGVNDWLNRDERKVDPTKEEMIIPKKFKITNAPPPLDIQVVIGTNKALVAVW